MDRAIGLVRRWARRVVAGVVLALVVPSVALAVTNTTFANAGPGSGSSTSVARPTISVTATDIYGVEGTTCFSMLLDGKAVKASMSYPDSADHHVVTISYVVPADLVLGSHRVTVSVTDIMKKSALFTWSFTIQAPSLPVVPPVGSPGHLTVTPECARVDCHATDLSVLHSKQGCTICHAPGLTPTKVCGSVGCHPTVTSLATHARFNSAHLLPTAASCFAAGCHTGGTDVRAMHTTAKCATCHINGTAGLTIVCSTPGCHGDHDAYPVSNAHPTMVAGHTASAPTCAKVDCHSTDVLVIHAKVGCTVCHAPGKTPTHVCNAVGCHPTVTGLTTHAHWNSAHLLPTAASCFSATCHTGGTDVRAMHLNPKCATCHINGTDGLTVVCATPGCHGPADSHPSTDPHPGMAAAHTTGLPASCVSSSCHAADLVALHAAKKGCATCHVAGKKAPTGCTAVGCHPDGGGASHTSHPATLTSAPFRINNLNYGTYACTLCHASTDLQVLHGGASSCAKCHPGPADTATPWDGGCSQAGCHSATSSRPMHTDVSASHLTTTQPSCTQDGCHFGNSSVGGRDVVLMHFAKQGCATCHGPGKTPTLDCVKCHPEALTGDHQNAHKICNDCHAPFVWNNATATANKGANLGVVHWSMFDANWTVLIGRAKIRPGYPHGDYTMLVFPGPIGGPGPYTSAPYPAGNTGTYTCTTCHTGAGKVWVHPGSDYFTCGSGGDCHQHHGNWDPAELSDSYVHNTPPASWRVVMKW